MDNSKLPLAPYEIRKINKELLDPDGIFFVTAPNGMHVRFESIIDFALLMPAEHPVRSIFKKRTNLQSALTIVAALEEEKNNKFTWKQDWISGETERILCGESYRNEFKASAFKCPPPDLQQRSNIPWWTWLLNEYQKNVYGYSTEVVGIINGSRILRPTLTDRKTIVFDRPHDIGENEQINFTLHITLTDDQTSEEIRIEVPLAFAQ